MARWLARAASDADPVTLERVGTMSVVRLYLLTPEGTVPAPVVSGAGPRAVSRGSPIRSPPARHGPTSGANGGRKSLERELDPDA
jgi:hypothetical protein